MDSEKAALWHNQEIEHVLAAFGTNPETGLTPEEAKARLARYGRNELAEKPRPGFFKMLLDQFNNFVVILLIVAAVISLLLGDVLEAGAIMAIVILNAVLGVVQESKAEQALAALKKMAAPEAQVLRGGHRITIPAGEVVPGDIVFLEAGNYVPADLRLIESVNLKIDEASLTGESVPVEKNAKVVLPADAPLGDRINSAFMSTTVTYGRGIGVAVATGMQTQIGHIAELIQSYEEEATPLQMRLDQLGRWLGWGALALCAIVFIEELYQGTDWRIIFEQGFLAYLQQMRQEIVDMFIIAVSLAIAAVPEGLPAVVTICLALGMREMVRRHALIRRLPAVETLGSANVICSDKTGTLTQNQMMVVKLYVANLHLDVSGEGYNPKGDFRNDGKLVNPQDYPEIMELLTGGLLCSDARLEVVEAEGNPNETRYRMVGDPTEGALVVAAAKAGLWREDMERRYPRVTEVPFDSDRKRMTTIHRWDGRATGRIGEPEYIAYVKGAPDVMLGLSEAILENGTAVPLTPARRQHIENVIRDLGRAGLRVLAIAYRHLDYLPERVTAEEVERELVLIGLVAMTDPARPEVAPAIEKARRAGIRTVMITGDYPDTARAIAQDIGLLRPGSQVVTGSELNAMTDDELDARVDMIDVYARVSPEHKVRIVEALKRKDYVVAMTGDGVNDAPALKRASIGVAMGITGTDVSKETADMVLTDDNYASIVAAVEQGRIIYSNIRKFVFFLLSCNIAEIMVIFLATMFGTGSPLTAIQLLWLNLLTDGAPALALGLEKGDPDIMEQPPRPVREPIINRPMLAGIIVQTIAITSVVLIAFFTGLRWNPANPDLAKTMAFVTLSMSELFRAYTSRSERVSLFKIGVFSNRYMQYAVLASFILLFAVVYIPWFQPVFDTVPLGREWFLVLPLLLVPSIAAEVTKAVMRWVDRRRARVAPAAV